MWFVFLLNKVWCIGFSVLQEAMLYTKIEYVQAQMRFESYGRVEDFRLFFLTKLFMTS